jgi:hypothetical protein
MKDKIEKLGELTNLMMKMDHLIMTIISIEKNLFKINLRLDKFTSKLNKLLINLK